MTKISTREGWLNEGVKLIKPMFKKIGQKVPDSLKVSCGFPSRNPLGANRRAIGECWSDKASAGKYFEIFISPTIQEQIKVLATLTHEIVHATVGIEHQHRKPFVDVARALGLEGKPTATFAGEALTDALRGVATKLGPYPHAVIDGLTNGKPKDVCRLLKATCPKCGYVIRVTKKWMEAAGLPICPTCNVEFEGE